MSDRTGTASAANHVATSEQPRNGENEDRGMSDQEARTALDQGDNQKIDKVLDEVDVSTTESGEDQTAKPDTEGSNSSSKNIDEQRGR